MGNSSAFGQPAVFTAAALRNVNEGEPSAAETVRAIYGQVLKRTADSSGLASYVKAIEEDSKTVKEIVREPSKLNGKVGHPGTILTLPFHALASRRRKAVSAGLPQRER